MTLLLLIIPAWLLMLSLIVGVCSVARRGDMDMGAQLSATPRPVAETPMRRQPPVSRAGQTAHRAARAEIAA
jgi:hypothetical protein